MPFPIPRTVYFPTAYLLACVSLLAVDGDIQPQVMISSRFFEMSENGTDILSAPKITTLSGQKATIQIGQALDEGKVFDGIYLSLKATVCGDKVSLEGVTFIGKQTVGEEGMESKSKNALSLLAERQGAKSGKPKPDSSSFADKVEMRGMFRMKGKPPRISLQLKTGGSFWIELGQTRSGIKLIHVDLSDDDSHAIFEKGGHFARVDLETEKVSDLDFLIPLEGGGSAFLQEVSPRQSLTFPLVKPDGKKILVELSVGIVTP